MSKSPDTIDSLLDTLKKSVEAESKEIRDTVDYISSWLTSLVSSFQPLRNIHAYLLLLVQLFRPIFGIL